MTALSGAGEVSVGRTADGVVHVKGVQRCASVWACPVCAPTIRERRATEVDQGVREALKRGYHVYFVTATVRHQLGDHLSDVLDLVTSSWRATFAGRFAATLKAAGFVGQIRNIEVTHGANGWHPHIHAVLIFRARPGTEAVVRSIGSRFGTAVASRGGISIVPGPGWNMSRCGRSEAVSSYLTKVDGGWGVGLEMTRGDIKLSRGKGRTAFDLLADAVGGDAHAALLFRIYEEVTSGRRFLVWSRGLKALFGVNEVTDEEAAEAVLEHPLDVEWRIPVRLWHKIRSAGWLWLVLANAKSAPPDVCIVTGERSLQRTG